LGVNPDVHYEQYAYNDLATDQVILLATDGVWEARNRHGEMFGKDAIRRAVRRNSSASAGEILNAVFDDLNRFAGSWAPEDDRTMIVIKVSGD